MLFDLDKDNAKNKHQQTIFFGKKIQFNNNWISLILKDVNYDRVGKYTIFELIHGISEI